MQSARRNLPLWCKALEKVGLHTAHDESGNDRVRLRQNHFRREDDRLHDGHGCLVSVNDRMCSGVDYVRTINKHDASGNDRVRLRNRYLRDANNRL